MFARSVYLQGALLLPEEAVPPHLAAILPVRRELAALAAEGGMTLGELAVRYALAIPGLSCVLLGVDTPAQMAENLACSARGPLESEVVEKIEARVPAFPDAVLLPYRWPKS